MHHVFDRWERWQGELRTRPTGSLVADRRGQATAFAIAALQERGSLFVAPRTELYEGMVVGENSRDNDLDVNASKEKKLTNMRSATADELVRLIPRRRCERSGRSGASSSRGAGCPLSVRRRSISSDAASRVSGNSSPDRSQSAAASA